MWDLHNRRNTHTFDAHTTAITSLNFCDAKLATSATGNDDNLSIWDVNNGEVQLVRKYKANTESVNVVRLAGHFLLSGGVDRTIKVWDIRTSDLVKTFTGHTNEVTCLEFLDNVILSGSTDGTIKEWSMEGTTQQCLSTYTSKKEKACMTLRFDNVHQIMAGGYKGYLGLWDYHTERCVLEVKANGSGVLCMDWCQDLVVSGGRDKVLKLWSLQPKKTKVTH